MPRRYQHRRTSGWTMPDGPCTSDANTWGKPFRTNQKMQLGPADVVAMYEQFLTDHPEIVDLARRQLAGRDLACWCRLDQPCHADVLLKLANQPGEST